MDGLKRQSRRAWDAAQPYLATPRYWTAFVLRRLLFRTTFIAISGSNGKSTATRFLTAILSSSAPTQWTRKNRNGMGGITETIAFCHPWKTRYAVFEVAIGKTGAIGRAMKLLRPDMSLMLAVFLEHRSQYKTLEGVAREKALLLAGLPPHGVAVVNASDPRVAAMPVPEGRRIIRFGQSSEFDAYCENVTSNWPQLLRFTAVVAGERQEVRTRLLGSHWIGPLLACIATAHDLGVPLPQIAAAIEQVEPYPGRMQVVKLPSGAIAIRDEFKASQHTIDAAFEEVAKATADRKILAICDLSESSSSPRKRLRRLGRQAAQVFDCVLFVGPKAEHGVAAARSAGLSEDQALGFADYHAALAYLKPLLGPGDLVLFKAQLAHQLTRLFYGLLGDVHCTIPHCGRDELCDECPKFGNPELVRLANEQLTVRVV